MTDPDADEFPPLEFEVHTEEKLHLAVGDSSQQKLLNQNDFSSQPATIPLLSAQEAEEEGDEVHFGTEPIQHPQLAHRDNQFEETLYRERHVEIEVPMQAGRVEEAEHPVNEHQDDSEDDAPLAIPRAGAPIARAGAPIARAGGVTGEGDAKDEGEGDGGSEGIEEDADDGDVEYEVADEGREDEDDIVLPSSQRRRRRRNAPRRRAPPKRLSFSQPESPRSKKARRCKRVECEYVNTRIWCTGPDGPGTLCYNCYMRYRDGRLVVYMDENTGKLSIANAEGMVPMRVTGFESKEQDGCNDLSRPKVIPVGQSEADLRLLQNSKTNGTVGWRKRRKAKEAVITEEMRKPFARMGGGTKPLAEGLAEGEGLYVKAEWRSDMRRFRVPHGVSLYAFREEIRRVFQWRKEQLFCVTFMDQRGDFVRLGDENKMQEMFQMIARHQMFPLRIRIIS